MINWERTDPENFVFLFASIAIKEWGSTIEVIAAEDTERNNSRKVTFMGCRQIRWEMIEPDEDDLRSRVVTILGFDLGELDYKTDAIIHGGFFELVFKYKTRQITNYR